VKLSQAIQYFATVHLDGWDGTDWVTGVVAGDFLAFDRFITDRSFGQKKRMFMTGGDTVIPDQYKVVRSPEGVRYLVGALNVDIAHNETYGRTYLLQECMGTAELFRFGDVKAASGLNGTKQEISAGTVFCDSERITYENSKEYLGVRYSSHSVFLPEGTVIDTTYQIQLDGHRYEVLEVNRLLKTVEARAVKLGASA
jgi:hypothetical protein